ncbi:DUF134 domain-containing protein [Ruminococcus sp. OA3]|uniref:DUF134 domain-containing protein n=1 Tax=Ruminococcus sp. OA3 TaxID=2914164 RepID=UPI001F05FED1|nr:DUF134 domain-containing protein [Ruminococcus sp. OA3]MCH1982328.1 DUF134 domain-containing protein [Ruminococcus sp. OA3]
MPRPCKRRRICGMPQNRRFLPSDIIQEKKATVIMGLDEYETIRLIDFEGMNQEECARSMEVARTTVQAIYNSARRKLAECLVEGKELYVDGGDYILCEGENRGCGCGHCRRRPNFKGGKCDENSSNV